MDEEEIRDDERRKIWAEINKWIIPGPMQGNGCDKTAQRNGLILASNLVHALVKEWPVQLTGTSSWSADWRDL